MNDGTVDAVVLAAGRAARMHGQDKTLALLGGEPFQARDKRLTGLAPFGDEHQQQTARGR